MVPGGFVVVVRSMLMMFRCVLVVFGCFFSHGEFPLRFLLCSLHLRIIRT
jgi:hypothetical protein